MKIVITTAGRETIFNGFWFYENQAEGLGAYFKKSIYSDIDSLEIYAGVHELVYGGYNRLNSRKFPFAIYYKVKENTVFVYAVLDCRRNPDSINEQLDQLSLDK